MATRSTCPYCGAPVSAEARYCDHCGTPLASPGRTPLRRRERPAGRVAIWAFLFILFTVFSTGTMAGFRVKAGHFPLLSPSEPVVSVPLPDVTKPVPPLVDMPAGEEFRRSVVSIHVRGTQGIQSGSGFLIDSKGHVVTASHVVEGAGSCLTVIDDNGRSHDGVVLGRNLETDVALLHVPGLINWPTHLSFGVSANLRRGEEVFVLGSPKGVGNAVRLTAEVSRLGDELTVESRHYRNLIQFDGATVLEGASGGPLIEKSTGQVIGVVVLGSQNAALAWATPIDDVVTRFRSWSSAPVEVSCSSQPAASTVPVVLSTITPLSGRLGVEGTDLADGVELAIRDMDSLLRSLGFSVTLRRLDDEGSASTGSERAATAAYDPRVIGVVGSLDNQVTYAVADALRSSGLPVVAPMTGASELTASGWTHFNRLVADTSRQEQATARFIKDRLQARSIFLLEETLKEADPFHVAAQAIPLSVVDRMVVPAGPDLSELKRRVVESRAEAIYYAGHSETALRVVQALRQDGLLLPFLGGQALFDHQFENFRGPGASQVYFSRITAQPPEPFQRKFEGALGRPTRGYAAYGYDAATVILSALARYGEAHPGQVPDRAELARLVRETRGYPGWYSLVTFDAKGDNQTSLVYMFEWKQGVPELRASMP